MGDVMSKNAAAETIMDDVNTTLTRARARGGKWAELAERLLVNTIRLLGVAGAEREKAEGVLRGRSEAQVDGGVGLRRERR